MTEPEKKVAPMRYCFSCGEELGRYFDYEIFDTCGSHECSKAEREAYEYERARDHEQLDRDMGY